MILLNRVRMVPYLLTYYLVNSCGTRAPDCQLFMIDFIPVLYRTYRTTVRISTEVTCWRRSPTSSRLTSLRRRIFQRAVGTISQVGHFSRRFTFFFFFLLLHWLIDRYSRHQGGGFGNRILSNQDLSPRPDKFFSPYWDPTSAFKIGLTSTYGTYLQCYGRYLVDHNY